MMNMIFKEKEKKVEMIFKDRLKNVEMILNQLEFVKKVLIVFKYDKLIFDKN